MSELITMIKSNHEIYVSIKVFFATGIGFLAYFCGLPIGRMMYRLLLN